MELHESIRELVVAHGTSMFDDASGFRGVLDDILEEDQATTGDINLLVDAVRFDVLTPLVAMIDGGADPQRAVEEAGLRLARDRGGDDQAASSWASAVLGYAVGKVPEAVLLRYRSLRGPSSHLPPGAAPPSGPPVQSPPFQSPPVQSPPSTAWPQQPPQPPSGFPSGPPTVLPAHQSAPQAPFAPSYPVAGGYPSGPGYGSAPPKKKGAALWIAAAVAGVVVVGGGITGIVLAGGGDDDPNDPGKSSSADPELVPAEIDARYTTLASRITSGASDCVADEVAEGEKEVISCKVSAGTLKLVTYADAATLTKARDLRLDYRAGTLTANNGSTALYEFDPENGGSSAPAIVYWDSTAAAQSATITGEGSVKIDSLVALYKASSPLVSEPTRPEHSGLIEFININMDVDDCKRQHTFLENETEESLCQPTEGIVVNVGRYGTGAQMRKDRQFYKENYDSAATNGGKQGGGPTWRFGEGKVEGAYYAYLDKEGVNSTLYWDYNKSDCYCYGVARSFDGNLKKLEKWWPSTE